MTKYVLTTLVAGSLLSVALADDKEDPAKDLKALQGRWRYVAREENGKASDPALFEGWSLVIEKDTLTMMEGPNPVYRGTFKIDPSKKPRAIDLTITKGVPAANGKVQLGVYEIDKDTLKWCTAFPDDKARPKEFSTKKDGKSEMWTFKREKR